ncbi:MAG: hypothetical protein QXH20_05865 [Candidatus Bathyarchaeia archaeon]
MTVRLWMIRFAGEDLANSFSLSELVSKLNSGCGSECAAKVYSFINGVLDWGNIVLDALRYVHDVHQDGDELNDVIVGVRIELDKLNFLRERVRVALINRSDVYDYDNVVMWYMEARMILNKIRRLFNVNDKFESVLVDIGI